MPTFGLIGAKLAVSNIIYVISCCLELIKFIAEEYFTKHANITTTTKITKTEFFTKAIKMPFQKAWVRRDQMVQLKRGREAKVLEVRLDNVL